MTEIFGEHFELYLGAHFISTDSRKLDFDIVSGFLARSYWAAGRSREATERSIANSLCFGLYQMDSDRQIADADPSGVSDPQALRQVGFARVVTDYATFAWLCDVYISEESRGRGLGKQLVETVVSHPGLQGLRRWMLATADAHELYRRFGFVEMSSPERWMERFSP